jgi:large conductance mechanosensitive channel
MGMMSEFKEFAMKGSVMDLAIGVVIGGAFQKIVDSMVNDVIMPVVGLLTGGVDFANRFVVLKAPASGVSPATLEEAKKAAVPVLAYGAFLNQVLTFVIIAFVLFMVIKGVNRMRRTQPAKA